MMYIYNCEYKIVDDGWIHCGYIVNYGGYIVDTLMMDDGGYKIDDELLLMPKCMYNTYVINELLIKLTK